VDVSKVRRKRRRRRSGFLQEDLLF